VSETAELAAALAAAQAELPEVKKNRSADVKNKEGKFLYSYSYADLADVSAAVLPVLGRHGLAFTAFPGNQPDGKFGLRYYLLHSGGASLEGFFEIDDKGGMQLVGGRITYARRYCLCAVTGITADEDVDARDDGPSRTAQRARPRTQTSPPAAAATPSAAAPSTPRAQAAAGGDLPPLPGEEVITAPVSGGDAREAKAPKAGSPDPGRPGDERHRKLVGAVQGQFKRLEFTDDDRDERLEVAAVLAKIDPVTSLNEMTHDELSDVAGTLSRLRNRDALTAHLVAQDKAMAGEPGA
jgi:hypothetical protein